MRRMFLLSLLSIIVVAGCQNQPVGYEYEYDEYDDYIASLGCNNGNPGCMAGEYRAGASIAAERATNNTNEIRFSTPNGNDLVLETSSYILQVEGAPNKKYEYYVWTGDKKYSDDPDLIIQDGRAAILVED